MLGGVFQQGATPYGQLPAILVWWEGAGPVVPGRGGVVLHFSFVVLIVILVNVTVVYGTNIVVFTRHRC